MAKSVAIIGLGTLGFNLARLLAEQGAEVIAIDSKMDRVEEIKDHVTTAVCMNATQERALVAQDLAHVDVAVVCIGENFQANLLATVLLKKIGVKRVITRASSSIEHQILEEVGADELIFPEEDLAHQLATRLTAESLLDLIPLGPELEAAKVKAPRFLWGKSLVESNLRSKFQINVIAVYEEGKSLDKQSPFPRPEMIIREDHILLIVGRREALEKFLNI
jgi:trk system potassium uptake protein TrkA